jgi:glycosyltransferase involved in cell wall biosynthesis
MKNPDWLKDHLYEFKGVDDIPQHVFDSINTELDKRLSKEPLVSVVICAYNEETNLIKTISSLSRLRTKYPFEILVVNNNSDDRTQETLDRLHVRSVFQPIQGWGPARQMGLNCALGKYLLTADADAIYPPDWLDKMTAELEKPGVVCVYGRYSFIAEEGFPRWQLSIFEKMKDIVAELRHFKRPFLNTYGLSMGLVREYALKVGYVMRVVRGEDGRMCFDLMQFGKVRQVKARDARVWTFPRTLRKEGSLTQAMINRVTKEFKRFHTMFSPMEPHDTKTSSND